MCVCVSSYSISAYNDSVTSDHAGMESLHFNSFVKKFVSDEDRRGLSGVCFCFGISLDVTK